MKLELLEILRCPVTRQKLTVSEAENDGNYLKSGWLQTEDGKQRHLVKNFIPRFVPQSNYADNFGMQWNKFRLTQMDSHTKIPISEERFYQATIGQRRNLKENGY
jgi:uncharacterized protein YbaR (Trm112 family)